MLIKIRSAVNNHADNQNMLKRLDTEIRAVEKQVDGWMKDLAEVSHDRTRLNVK
jgi:hypothetical protein